MLNVSFVCSFDGRGYGLPKALRLAVAMFPGSWVDGAGGSSIGGDGGGCAARISSLALV